MPSDTAPPTLASIIEAEPGIGHLLDLAAEVSPTDRPRAAAFAFYRKAAAKLAGPAARRPGLRDPAMLQLVIRKFASILGVQDAEAA